MKNNENIFIENLKNFLKQQNITQTQLAKQVGVSNASVSNYISGTNEPPLSFLQKLKTVYNICLDDFLTQKLYNAEKLTLSDKNLERFIGNYFLYFYDTSAYTGRSLSHQKSTLKYGILSVVPQNNTLACYSIFFEDFFQAKKAKHLLDSQPNAISRLNLLETFSEIVYNGTFEVSQTQIFIFLKSFNDQSLIILNNPPSNRTYIGGLGTVNSVSRGREHMPSIQFLLIARNQLNLPEGELYNMLALDTVNINTHNQTEKLLDLFKNLYLTTNQNTLKLEEFQKKKIFENALENIVSEAIEANVFRFAKISAREDDEYYNLIKKNEQES